MVWVKNTQKSNYLLTYYKLHQIYCMHDGHRNSRYQMMMNQRIYDLMIDLGKPTIILWFEYLMKLDVVSTLCGVYSNDPKWAIRGMMMPFSWWCANLTNFDLCSNNFYTEHSSSKYGHTKISKVAKLGGARGAHAPRLFLPRPEVIHIGAQLFLPHSEIMYISAPRLFSPVWRQCPFCWIDRDRAPRCLLLYISN